MKLSKLFIAFIAIFSFAIFAAPAANAQFGGVLNKTKNKVKDKTKEAEGKTKPAPKTVIDYLKILPKSYSQIITANASVDRLSLIKYDRRKSGFLRLGAKNFMGYAEIALFKKKSGGHLVAVNEYAQNSTCCDGGVAFYEYNKGKWKEVEVLPRFSSGDLRTAFHGKTKRQPTDEEMEMQILEMHEPNADEITLKIGGIAVYGFRLERNRL